MRPRAVAATILLLAAVLAVAWALVVLLSGGIAAGFLVSRDPIRPFIAGALLAVIARVLSPTDFDTTLARLIGQRDRWPSRIAMVMAACVFVVAMAWNTRAAGGSDSSCYVLQADRFVHGHVTLINPLASVVAELPPASLAPTGFIPSPARPREAVPICGAGLAIGMAGASLVGGRAAVFLVVPVCAALAVWLTFVVGRRLDDEVTGAAAALLLACSPIFLYQAVQPMSDVPATALWLGALAGCARGDRPGEIAAGMCASLAVLTRPNLAVAIVPLAWLIGDSRAWMRFAVAALPGLVVLAWLNAVRYGSPIASGYGESGALFSSAHVAANAARYLRWLIETHSPVILLALGAPWAIFRDSHRRRVAWVALIASALVVITYLFYTVFDDWWYVRFLLPAIPIWIVLAVAVLLRGVGRLWTTAGSRILAAVTLCAIGGSWYIHVARERHAFDLQAIESRFVLTGRYARTQPPNAVFIAGQHTGSIRYHGERATLAWDGLTPSTFDSLIDTLARSGYAPQIVLEDAEEPLFRRRFAGQRFGALDWPPSTEVRALTRVRVYDPRRAQK